ncbi:hypothetical protein JHK85_046285 [Glycine max]|nr:hypothetical protein JHK85_046285 [Glycine max]
MYKVEMIGETSSMVTIKVKGHNAVHEASGLQDSGHILKEGKNIYNTTLNMSDLSTGINIGPSTTLGETWPSLPEPIAVVNHSSFCVDFLTLPTPAQSLNCKGNSPINYAKPEQLQQRTLPFSLFLQNIASATNAGTHQGQVLRDKGKPLLRNKHRARFRDKPKHPNIELGTELLTWGGSVACRR